jgi:double-stranded uracil-DNA glycosylase
LNNQFMAKDSKPAWENLRLTDRIEPGVRVLLVGINPGVMSATTGHHFAGPTNRFWRLLYEAGIVPEPVTHLDDDRLPAWGIGMTNLIARPSPGIDVLKPQEYLEGWQILEKKIDRFRPKIVAFVGVTMYRALWRVLGHTDPPVISPGFQTATVHEARVFVLPNPSGRNAHFSYDDMLAAFRELARAMKRLPGKVSEPPRSRRRRADASSAGSTAAAAGKSRRAAGTAARTTPSTPAAAPVRRATRKPARSRS